VGALLTQAVSEQSAVGAVEPGASGLIGVTAVVLTHMRPRLASAAVRSLVADEGFAPGQVVVVVNGVGGLDDPVLESMVRMVRLPTNQGPAAGFARGMAEAFADPATRWAYVCEDDFTLLGLPTPRVAGLLERVAALEEDPAGRRVGAVVPFGRTFVDRSGHTVNVVPRLGSPGELAPVHVSTWGATLVSRRVFDAGVHPDAELFFGFEDFDFFCALRDAGFSVMVDVPCARRVAHLQTSAGREAAIRVQRPTDSEEPWRAFYFARNFFALARRHGRRSWLLWHLLYSVRRLQLAGSRAERLAIVRGLLHGWLGRLGTDGRYVRDRGERPPDPEPARGAGEPPDGADRSSAVADATGRPATTPAPRVAALILTHNAPDALHRCLRAVAGQTLAPQAVLVTDNASDPPVCVHALDPTTGAVPVSVIRSDANLGPAGGWARALAGFLDTGFDHAWVLDDDIVPDPDCLERLWSAVGSEPTAAFLFPRAIQPDGSVGEWGSWCGFLVSRRIVETVGLPRAELFWWAEDNEYCHWRIPQAGFPRRIVDGALVQHDAVRHETHVPTWKYYYEARNMLYLHLHVMRRVGWYPKNVTKLVGRAVLHERGRRLRSFRAIGLGLHDGARARLGIRYPVEPMREVLAPGSPS